jgi:hypothetical protein
MQGGAERGDMLMTDRDTGEILEVWRCKECQKIWFRRPGMTGFFMIQPIVGDPFAQQ